MQFLFVYIREAGASSPGQEPAQNDAAPRDPETDLERLRIANSFAKEVELSIPCVVDGMDDAAMKAYAAHPARLYLVGRDGRIALAGRPASGRLDPGELARAEFAPPEFSTANSRAALPMRVRSAGFSYRKSIACAYS